MKCTMNKMISNLLQLSSDPDMVIILERISKVYWIVQSRENKKCRPRCMNFYTKENFPFIHHIFLETKNKNPWMSYHTNINDEYIFFILRNNAHHIVNCCCCVITPQITSLLANNSVESLSSNLTGRSPWQFICQKYRHNHHHYIIIPS